MSYPTHHVDLPGAFDLLAEYLGADAQALRAYAAADPYPRLGWDGGQGEAPIGSVWSVEGIVLYALVRWAAPETVIELGTSAGASTTHLAAALEANGGGTFTSVDNLSILSPGYGCGELIPDALRARVKLVEANGVTFIQGQARADFILEDMVHMPESVSAVWARALDILTPGGLIVSHDAAHPLYTDHVQAGIAAALGDDPQPAPLLLLIRPSDTGLVIWRKSGARIDAE